MLIWAFKNNGEKKVAIKDAINKSSHQHLEQNIDHSINNHGKASGKLSDEVSKPTKNFSETQKEAQKIAPLYQPLPDIPEDLRYDFFSSKIVAKFFIDKNGRVYEVELIKPSSIPKLNFLLKKSLLKWQFPAQNAEYFQIINVKFSVD